MRRRSSQPSHDAALRALAVVLDEALAQLPGHEQTRMLTMVQPVVAQAIAMTRSIEGIPRKQQPNAKVAVALPFAADRFRNEPMLRSLALEANVNPDHAASILDTSARRAELAFGRKASRLREARADDPRTLEASTPRASKGPEATELAS